jgi:fumarate reductase flavoprotein subunit
LARGLERARIPFAPATGGSTAHVEEIRERLYATMWDDAGIVRDAAGLARAAAVLGELADALRRYRLPDAARDPAFNMTWHDWLNLTSLVDVSRVIVRAAQARENSRGAHYRADFPEPGDLETSTYTRVCARDDGALSVDAIPVVFTRVRPGETLL